MRPNGKWPNALSKDTDHDMPQGGRGAGQDLQELGGDDSGEDCGRRTQPPESKTTRSRDESENDVSDRTLFEEIGIHASQCDAQGRRQIAMEIRLTVLTAEGHVVWECEACEEDDAYAWAAAVLQRDFGYQDGPPAFWLQSGIRRLSPGTRLAATASPINGVGNVTVRWRVRGGGRTPTRRRIEVAASADEDVATSPRPARRRMEVPSSAGTEGPDDLSSSVERPAKMSAMKRSDEALCGGSCLPISPQVTVEPSPELMHAEPPAAAQAEDGDQETAYETGSVFTCPCGWRPTPRSASRKNCALRVREAREHWRVCQPTERWTAPDRDSLRSSRKRQAHAIGKVSAERKARSTRDNLQKLYSVVPDRIRAAMHELGKTSIGSWTGGAGYMCSRCQRSVT